MSIPTLQSPTGQRAWLATFLAVGLAVALNPARAQLASNQPPLATNALPLPAQPAATNQPDKSAHAPASATNTPPAKPLTTKGAEERLIVNETLTGKVVRVNKKAKFVVLSFPISRMPAVFDHLDVIRAGKRVGELRVSGPQRDETIVADIVQGECELGDEASNRPTSP